MTHRQAVNRAEGFRRMIAKLAIETWRMIPHQHQVWIGIDDLVEDGMFVAYQIIRGRWYEEVIEDGVILAYKVIKKEWYDEDKSSVSTAIYHTVHNYFFNEYIARYGNEKRFASLESAGIIDYDMKHRRQQKGNTPAGVVSLDIPPDVREDRVFVPLQLSTSERVTYDTVLTDCFVVPVLGSIYREATSKLKNEMVTWFFDPREKLHLKSPKFRVAAKEFRMLSREHNLTYYDCEHLIHSVRCMNKLSHEFGNY